MFMADANANLYMIHDLTLDAKNGTSWKKQKKEKQYVRDKRMEYYSSLEKFKQMLPFYQKYLKQKNIDKENMHEDLDNMLLELAEFWCKVDLEMLDDTKHLRSVTKDVMKMYTKGREIGFWYA